MSAVDPLYAEPALVRFYDLDNGWAPDCDFVAGLAQPGMRLLDLGCGTGVLGAALAQRGVAVTGVDPAAAMLAVARARTGGTGVRWIEGDALALRLPDRFDLVVMTGHAFQVFLTDADRLALLRTIAAHLAPGGRFVFDTRNPAVEEWRLWTPKRSRRWLEDAEFGPVLAWNDVQFDPVTQVAHYLTVYRLSDGQEHRAEGAAGFVGRETLAGLLDAAGLAVERWLGDWQGHGCAADAPEIIPLGTLARAGGLG